MGRTRHYLGICLFLLNVAATYLIVWYAMIAFSTVEAAGAEGVPVWGMNLEQQSAFVLSLFIAGEVGFLLSLYLLGADWWQKFRNLFVWSPP